ncbi:MAG: hypothetical protein ACREQY_19440, partial [Candidatus Binatia bacterium]
VVDVSLGSGLAQGVGVAVDALVSGEGSVAPSVCSGGVICANPPPLATSLGSTDDEYNSANSAVALKSPGGSGFETEVWSITRSLGSGNGGYGVFADAGLLGVGNFGLATSLGGIGLAYPNADRYNSGNGCDPYFLFDSSNFGSADGGAGAFVEAFGDDLYEQDSCFVLTLLSYGHATDPLALGIPPSIEDVAVFADLWGRDAYPVSVFPPPAPILGTPSPPDNDGVWTGVGAGLGLGLDLLPNVPPVP